MNGLKHRAIFIGAAMLVVGLSGSISLSAQESAKGPSNGRAAPSGDASRHPADGERHGLPLETFAVTPGTKFLVRLEDELSTKRTEENSTFRVRTLEPLEAGSGFYLASGAEIAGHVSRVEAAGVAGRAKIWLTFDELHTQFGPLPIVAEVVSVGSPVPSTVTLRVGTETIRKDIKDQMDMPAVLTVTCFLVTTPDDAR